MNASTQPARGGVRRSTLVALALALVPAAAFGQPAPPSVAPAAQAPAYRVAFSGGVAVGGAGWGTVLGEISDVSGRVQVLPWLGVGLSYLQFGAPNNEGYDPFEFHAFEVTSAWHPVVGRWFDPFVQIGALGVVGSEGGYMSAETTSRFGLEALAGFDVVHLPLAVGVHARSGFTNRAWTLAGLHLEVRI
jgi:hypothetical protein